MSTAILKNPDKKIPARNEPGMYQSAIQTVLRPF
jgi:hypothetical protein